MEAVREEEVKLREVGSVKEVDATECPTHAGIANGVGNNCCSVVIITL